MYAGPACVAAVDLLDLLDLFALWSPIGLCFSRPVSLAHMFVESALRKSVFLII
jgi:hypothetical protein